MASEINNLKCAQKMLENMEDIDFPKLRRTKFPPEWISIKKNVPLSYEMALVYCPDEQTKIKICQLINWEGAEKIGITHWQSLPDAPESKEKNE